MHLFTQTDIMILMPLFVLTGGLGLVIIMDTFIPRSQRLIMMLINALVISLIVQNMLDYYLESHSMIPLRLFVGVYGYCIRPLILVLFIILVDPERSHPFEWMLSTLNTLIYLTSFYTHLTFWYNEENHFQRGPLGFTCHFISLILLIWMLYINSVVFQRERLFQNLIPFLCGVHIILGTLADVFIADTYYVTFLTIAGVLSTVFYYMWLHFQLNLRREKALIAAQQIQIMISQIQPHFMFNTLSTIQALCRIDPEKAFDTLGKFGIYLRNNIESMTKAELIPFQQELEHTKVYADIEMIRFPSIHVEYDINDDDFLIPPLSLQPLVENAIRHGVRIRRNGVVRVTTGRDADFHFISISDNGKGFNVEEALNADSSHIGLRNVRDRIEQICGGELKIESRIGKGSTLTIRIPAKPELSVDSPAGQPDRDSGEGLAQWRKLNPFSKPARKLKED